MSRLILGIPSKGRLQDNAHAFFGRAGLAIRRPRGQRDYRGHIEGLDGVEIAFLSASEIAGQLAAGTIHLGVTGEDLVREEIRDAERRVALVSPLGFGHANVVVAVPQAWIDVRAMQDVDDVAADIRARHGRRLRVATKYVNLTRAHFARHAVGDYRIVESLGATEAAPASGAADIIVDITSTGATLAANGLKLIEDGLILESQANLVASLGAEWSEGPRAALAEILTRVAAEERGRLWREVSFHADDPGAVLPEGRSSFGIEVPSRPQHGHVVVHCLESNLFGFVAFLRGRGAGTVVVRRLDYVFAAENPLLDALNERLPAKES